MSGQQARDNAERKRCFNVSKIVAPMFQKPTIGIKKAREKGIVEKGLHKIIQRFSDHRMTDWETINGNSIKHLEYVLTKSRVEA